MLHLTHQMHAQLHWRPDAITRTGVIEPMWIRQVSPVDMARHTIDPFIASVRAPGPGVSPAPSPESLAYAAGQLAQLFAQGRKGILCLGTEKITVSPDQPPMGGVVGTIVQAAQELARSGSATVEIGGRRLIVNVSRGEPEVRSAPSVTTSNPNIKTETAPSTPPQMSVAARPEQRKSGFGQPSLPKPGHVPATPYFDYARAYRRLNYTDNVWARRNFQAKLASRFVPQPIMQMHAASRQPIHYAQAQAKAPLASRPLMVQRRWPHPEAVWPRSVTVNARPEQR
jgi:hypothetical protein